MLHWAGATGARQKKLLDIACGLLPARGKSIGKYVALCALHGKARMHIALPVYKEGASSCATEKMIVVWKNHSLTHELAIF